jgi:hypothetical protein
MLFIVLIFVTIGNCVQFSYKTPSFFDPYAKSVESPPVYSSGGVSSRPQIVSSDEIIPLNISRRIIEPRGEMGIFRDENVIVVLVKVTSLKKDETQNVEIWEIPGKELKIVNCSYPIITSSVGEILDYEKFDKSLIQNDDIINVTSIVKALDNKKDPLYLHIYNLLSNSTQEMLPTFCTLNAAKTSEALVRDFNKILNNTTNLDLNVTHFAGSKASYRNETLGNHLYQGYIPDLKVFKELKDHRLYKRRLLEDAFPYGIRTILYYKEHENQEVDKSTQSIHFSKDLGAGEAIIFKYYLHPNDLIETELRSIIRTKGFLHEEAIPIKIIEREPHFNIAYWCESKEIIRNDINEFKYFIEYLGGDENEKPFLVEIKAPDGCEIQKPRFPNENWKGDKTIQSAYHIFSKGKKEKFIVDVCYTQTGTKFLPPIVYIQNENPAFPAEISVLEDWDQPYKIHYETFSIILLCLATLISFISLFELLLLHKQTSQTKKERKINEKIIKANTEAFNKLSRQFKKIR